MDIALLSGLALFVYVCVYFVVSTMRMLEKVSTIIPIRDQKETLDKEIAQLKYSLGKQKVNAATDKQQVVGVIALANQLEDANRRLKALNEKYASVGMDEGSQPFLEELLEMEEDSEMELSHEFF